MKLRLALSALTAVAMAAAAPGLALAQPAATTSSHVVASAPVPNPPEMSKTTMVHKANHHAKAKHSHRRHKTAVTSAKVDAKEDKAEAARSAPKSSTTAKSTAVTPAPAKK